MQQIVEEAAKSTVNVMEKVNAATEEVGNNYELAGQLDNGFNNVKEAVEKALEQAQKEKDEAVEKALNEAKEVNKAETKKVIASEKENLVTVEIKKDREHREDVLVCVNGKNFQIKRGEKVEVPEYVCEVLENMKKMDELAIERMEKATKNFA